MAGIYFHIPFCRKACVYCDFHFSTNLKYKSQLVHSLIEELRLRREYLKGQAISSIYFGGGTPSVLNKDELSSLLEAVNQSFTLSPSTEITLEANPDDLDRSRLKAFQAAGINRLSIGVQSFRDQDLQFMNRSHTAEDTFRSVRMAQDLGIDNISIDLIYAIPGLPHQAWEENLNQAIDLKVPHISAYSLTVEEKTALAYRIKKGEVKAPDDHMAQEQFKGLSQLYEAGFEHYEISNLAKAGARAVHNSNYWKGEAYLGIGPSAHSFNGSSRQWNVANNAAYIRALEKASIPAEREVLTSTDHYNEYVMTNLRRLEGVNVQFVEEKFGLEKANYLHQEAKEESKKGNLVKHEDHYFIPASKRFFSDGIAASLFYI
jgi:oxygen-independent coproporphyrinogen-3 oxidase